MSNEIRTVEILLKVAEGSKDTLEHQARIIKGLERDLKDLKNRLVEKQKEDIKDLKNRLVEKQKEAVN